MKKRIAFLLLVAMCFGLFACASEAQTTQEPTETTQAPTTEEPTTQDPITEAPTTQAPAQDETPEAEATPLLYRVTDDAGNAIYLFGSIHVGDSRVEVLPEYVMDAYHESDFLAVELDAIALLNDMEKQTALTQMMVLTDGTTIADHLTPEVYDSAKAFLQTYGMYNEMYDYFHPFMWISLVENVVVALSGLDSELGIDMQFLQLAHDEGKEIREVESAEFQYELFLNFSDELLNLMLGDTVEEAELAVEETKNLYEAWVTGDENLINTLVSTDTEEFEEPTEATLYEEFNDAMVVQRNIDMAKKAQEYLQEGKICFFVVGMAHILGDGGCVDLLTQAGYHVELIQQ